MTWFYGPVYNLESLIQTHLFVICPNNSGSTFLKNVLATSRRTWNLRSEGQFALGFAGPNVFKLCAGRLWSSKQKSIDSFRDESAYNWPIIRKAWYFQAFSLDPQASIFVEKSPPFVLIVDQLERHFKNAKFLFMVRDPYAVVEGIRRQLNPNRHDVLSAAEVMTAAATHLMTAFDYQRRNIERYRDRGVFFTYEEMCETPEQVEQKIRTLAPELDDLKLRQQIAVKGRYEMLRNMNEEQISRLSAEDLRQVNQVLEQHLDLMDYFHYPIRTTTAT